ncbi:MAG: M23 family metallopeptidase [Lachnospira sp.]|nr:M23 family metallopeptidase [Lachnospira sp.]
MRRRKKNINKEKIVSVIVAGAILVTLGVGVYAVTGIGEGDQGNNNIVDLNETEAPNVAFKSEEATDSVLGGSDGSVSGESEAETDGKYYNQEEIAEIYDELGTEDATKKEENTKASEDKGAVVNAPAITDPAASYKFSEDSRLIWPVKGDIIMKYSMDSTILFKTLGVYRCNPAIMIKADAGTNVGVAADGVVTKVTDSEETGKTVSVAVGSDYVVTYGQLADVVVKAGDKVKSGQLLGTVAEPTAYYVEEGTHIYFAVTKNGVPVDPTEYLAE